MELDNRKIIILKTIIKNYLETGEPVGSRTISKYSGLNLSSATIRNEMSDLEEMGYILQPHTSAGRIPSDKGYRFYVDSIMQDNERKVNEVTGLMIKRVDKLEMLLKNLVKLLAVDTNYAALISGPSLSENKIKYLQLSVPSEKKLLLILVLEGNIIKNEVISIDEDLDYETVLNLTVMLNNHLSGLSFTEISTRVVSDIMLKAGEHSSTVKAVLDAVAEMLEAEEEREIFTSGATNIFKYPELAEIDKASELISAFEEKDQLKKLVSTVTSLSEGDEDNANALQVYIGGEGPIQNMQDCSLVTANYEIGDGLRGVIGVIGPKRMDYEKVLSTMQNLMNQLDQAFKKE
ncbi:MAG: heat-inducible transcriptional repressor HrcA [Eubacteriales bacterium]|nr:heat-inducible transcriptional repressor HrcA [Eubacteriales bacterium]